MARMTKRLQPNNVIVYKFGKYEDTIAAEMETSDVRTVLKALADYEDAEEQGLLLRFKCKVGDKIYCPAKELNKVLEFTIINIDIYEDEIFYVDDSSNMWDEKEFGTVVFITPEEAESALAEKGGAE